MELDDITFAEYRKKQKKKKIFWTTFLIIFLVGSISLICAILLIPVKGATAREWLETGIDEAGIDNVYKINLIGTYEEENYICYIYEFYRLEDASTVDEKFDNIISDNIDFYKTKEIKYVAYISFENPKIIFENKEAKHYTYCIDFDIARILE